MVPIQLTLSVATLTTDSGFTHQIQPDGWSWSSSRASQNIPEIAHISIVTVFWDSATKVKGESLSDLGAPLDTLGVRDHRQNTVQPLGSRWNIQYQVYQVYEDHEGSSIGFIRTSNAIRALGSIRTISVPELQFLFTEKSRIDPLSIERNPSS